MKKKTPALWTKIVSWVLSLALVAAMMGGMALAMVQTMLTDTALHERVALSDAVVSAQMARIEARVDELAQQHHFMPETVLNIVTREAVEQYGRDVVAWWTGMLQPEPELEIPEFEVAEVQAAVRADELFKENTSEGLRLRIARDEVAYEVGVAVRDAVLPIRTSLVELAAPVALAKVDVPRMVSLLDTAKHALLALCMVLLVIMMLICRGPAGLVYAGGAAAAAGLLMLLAALGAYLLDIPGMIAPLSQLLAQQVQALGGEMMKAALVKAGVMLIGGQALAGFSLAMVRRVERKRAA